MTKCLVSVFLGLSIALASSNAGAADTPGDQVTEQVETRLQREADALKGQGFTPADKIVVEPMGKADTRRYVLRLTQNITYAMIAGCDQDCQHVEITIFDAERQQLSRSTKKASIAIFSGAPDRTGLYEVEVTQPGCRQPTCHTGFLVMQQGGTLPKDGLIIAASRSSPLLATQARITAPAASTTTTASLQKQPATPPTSPQSAIAQSETAKSKPTPQPRPERAEPSPQAEPKKKSEPPKAAVKKAAPLPKLVNMERRFDTEILGENYRRLTNTSLTACERACVSDQRCRAVEYYKDNQSCGFFDDSPSMSRARGIDASVKRIAVR